MVNSRWVVESSTGIRAFAARATANETLAMFRQSVLTYLPIVPNTSPKEGTGERDADRPRQAGIEVADGHDRSMYRLRGMMVRAAMAASVGWPWRSFPQTMMRTIAITT